jgi:TatD DNase family protein
MSAANSFIDAHCHLERDTYGIELPEVMARAERAGLSHFIAVGASRVAAGAHEAVALARGHANVFAAVGIHPHDAAAADAAAMAQIDTLLAEPKVVSLGEVGLDYYYENAPKEQQKQVFAAFLAMAKRHNKPVMLHIREAHADAWDAIDAVGLPEAGGMVHCFTAGVAEAKAYLDRGMMLSIPGVVTFKNAAPLRDALQHIPRDRLLLETDSPFLAPVPYRGKRNEPSFLPATAQAVADVLGLPLEALAAQCHANTRRFFRF